MATIARFDLSKFDIPKFDDSSTGGGGGGGASDDISLGSYGLQNSSIKVKQVIYSCVARPLNKRFFPRGRGGYIETANPTETRITLKGTISKSTRLLLESEMDTMRKNFFAAEPALKITWAEVARYWDVYLENPETLFPDRDHYNITWCTWQATFVAVHPFGRSAARETFSGGNATAADTTFSIPHTGTATSEQIIDLTFTTVGTVSAITWENETTGEAISLSGLSLSNGDLVTINGEDKTVKKNGSTSLDYTGVFPTIAAGTNTNTLSIDTGSGHTIAVAERHYKRYL